MTGWSVKRNHPVVGYIYYLRCSRCSRDAPVRSQLRGTSSYPKRDWEHTVARPGLIEYSRPIRGHILRGRTGPQERPPRRIAVLPFQIGSTVASSSTRFRSCLVKEEQSRWSWTHTNRVRRALAGDIAAREFFIVSLLRVDALLAITESSSVEKLNAVSAQRARPLAGRSIRWSMVSFSITRRTTVFSSQAGK